MLGSYGLYYYIDEHIFKYIENPSLGDLYMFTWKHPMNEILLEFERETVFHSIHFDQPILVSHVIGQPSQKEVLRSTTYDWDDWNNLGVFIHFDFPYIGPIKAIGFEAAQKDINIIRE